MELLFRDDHKIVMERLSNNEIEISIVKTAKTRQNTGTNILKC